MLVLTLNLIGQRLKKRVKEAILLTFSSLLKRSKYKENIQATDFAISV